MPGLVIGLGFLLVFFLTVYLARNGFSLGDALTIVLFVSIFLFYFFTDFLNFLDNFSL